MSSFGGPAQAGLAGVTGTQEAVGQARAKREREKNEATRRFEDAADLRAAGLETLEAVRKAAENNTEDSRQKKEARDSEEARSKRKDAAPPNEPGARLDLKG